MKEEHPGPAWGGGGDFRKERALTCLSWRLEVVFEIMNKEGKLQGPSFTILTPSLVFSDSAVKNYLTNSLEEKLSSLQHFP